MSDETFDKHNCQSTNIHDTSEIENMFGKTDRDHLESLHVEASLNENLSPAVEMITTDKA